MSYLYRKAVFDAARAGKMALKGIGLSAPEVEAGDRWLDLIGFPKDGALIAPGAMHISPAGIALIKEFESLQLRAYRCPAGVWTIGYGATGPGIYAGLVWTEAQADARLASDLAACEAGVTQLLEGKPATQGQFDALVSFAFNCGLDIDNDHTPEGLGDSTLLRKHLAGDYAAAALEFGKWVNGGGHKLAGLVRRREREAALYRGA
jgi:lysozyme